MYDKEFLPEFYKKVAKELEYDKPITLNLLERVGKYADNRNPCNQCQKLKEGKLCKQNSN